MPQVPGFFSTAFGTRHQGKVVQQRMEQARQSLPKWRQFAALNLEKPDAVAVQTWFKADEARNIQWGLLALDAVVREDAEQKKLIGAVISNYTKLILASKTLGAARIANGGTGTGLGKAEDLWTTSNFDVGVSWLINAVQKAFRTAGLVRGSHPYSLIVDDLQLDAAPHHYDWGCRWITSCRRDPASSRTGRSYRWKFPPGCTIPLR